MSVPNLIKSRLAANEASAISSLRNINTAQTTYAITYPTVGYADNLAKLGAPTGGAPVGPNNAALLDWVLGCATQPCQKSGYTFVIINAGGSRVTAYQSTGTPVTPGTTGFRGFCGSNASVIMSDPNGGTNCTVQIQ